LGILAVTCLQVVLLNAFHPNSTAMMRLRLREAEAKHQTLTIKHTWIPISSVPKHLQKAVISAEDDGFYQHFGFDWEALRKAHQRNEKSDRIKRGGSTITQQLAKNLFLSPERSYWRKFREAWITLAMEVFLSKKRILELYLNSIEWGPGVFGIEEAAKYHFGVSAKRLTLEQSCRLASIIPSPRRYRINGNYVSKRAEILFHILSGKSYSSAEVDSTKINP
jgi:monofunctional biosynthetic peptidoglycan transglycosylase